MYHDMFVVLFNSQKPRVCFGASDFFFFFTLRNFLRSNLNSKKEATYHVDSYAYPASSFKMESAVTLLLE